MGGLLVEVVLHIGDNLHNVVVSVLLLVLELVDFDVSDDHSDQVAQENVVLQIVLGLNDRFIKFLDLVFFGTRGEQRLESGLTCLKFGLFCLLAF